MNNKPNTSNSGRKFYVSLFCAAALMVIMGFIGMQISKGQEDSGQELAKGQEDSGQELAQNQNDEQDSSLAEDSRLRDDAAKKDVSDIKNNAGQSTDLANANQGTELEDFSQSPSLPSTDTENGEENASPVFSNESQSLEDKKKQEENKDKKKKVKDSKKESKENTEKPEEPAESEETFVGTGLAFPEEDGLLWPITGDIILNYSMDKGVYFKTLGQYKCNPAILIKGSAGDKVLSSSNGTVESIEENEETGLTLTISAGDDSRGSHYEVVYGQLDKVKVSEGEMVSAGQVIGTLKEPTKYYISEGTHLYYEVLENGEPANPMLLLQ